MPTYISLVDFTAQGLDAIKDSPKRADAFQENAKAHGCSVKDVYWTSGAHDGVLIVDAPDDSAAAALFLSLARRGNVRTTTLRAFDRAEMEAILAKTE